MAKVLGAIARDTDAGRRDCAILKLLATYGVRAGEVAQLRLDDLDRHGDRIHFCTLKRGRERWLPLTREVVEALLDFLREARPKGSHRELFLTCSAPIRPLRRRGGVSFLVKRRLKRAGIELPGIAAHAFRHGFATQQLHDGRSSTEIADVLGQTVYYLKPECQDPNSR